MTLDLFVISRMKSCCRWWCLTALVLTLLVAFAEPRFLGRTEALKGRLERKIVRNLMRQDLDLCAVCDALLPELRQLVRLNETDLAAEIVIDLCIKLHFLDKVVCENIIQIYKPSLSAVARESTASSKEICSAALVCGPNYSPVFNWTVELPNVPKPPVKPLTPPKQQGAPTLRILHLSDIHIDFEYQPGALANCTQILCCRNSSTYDQARNSSTNPQDLAQYFGDYRNCDVPVWTVELMFEHIAQNEQFDLIYWTGDLPPHHNWNQTRSEQLTALDKLTHLFLKYFPSKVIYPTLGNHEAAPANLFPTPNIKQDNISWLYEPLARNWTLTGLPSYLEANITRGAFYTVPLYPGVRLISLNTNYCPKLNFWLLINSTDPLGQLKWLADTLQESENMGEKVHIIGHIPPSQCLASWSENYYKIVNRYESTIVAQFFGHTHSDEFEIFYDLKNDSRAVSVAYITGSVTTYGFNNPGYRIYTVDGFYANTSFQVLDHETYYMNLTEANLNGKGQKPVWRQEYSAKQAFNLTSLAPQNWSDMIDEASQNLNGTTIDLLLAFSSKRSDYTRSCDMMCRKTFACHFKQARYEPFIPCK